MLAWA